MFSYVGSFESLFFKISFCVNLFHILCQFFYSVIDHLLICKEPFAMLLVINIIPGFWCVFLSLFLFSTMHVCFLMVCH